MKWKTTSCDSVYKNHTVHIEYSYMHENWHVHIKHMSYQLTADTTVDSISEAKKCAQYMIDKHEETGSY